MASCSCLLAVSSLLLLLPGASLTPPQCRRHSDSLVCKGGQLKILPDFAIKGVRHLSWDGLTLDSLTSLPASSQLETLALTSLTLKSSVQRPFQLLKKLRSVSLSGCCLDFMPSLQTSSKTVQNIQYEMACSKPHQRLEQPPDAFQFNESSPLSVTIRNTCLQDIDKSLFAHSDNFTTLDLSNNNLSGRLELGPFQFNRSNRVSIKKLDVSKNSDLKSLHVLAKNLTFSSHWMLVIEDLDVSHTQVDLKLSNLQPKLTKISSLTFKSSNQTLQFNSLLDFLKNYNVKRLTLSGFNISQFVANFSEASNYCKTRDFQRISITNSNLTELRGNMSTAVISALHSVDFSSNKLVNIENVTFRSRAIDLSQNQLSSLVNVSFLSAKLCHLPLPWPPSLNMSHNDFTEFPTASLIGSLFTGIDFSHNPLSSVQNTSEIDGKKVWISEFLNLSGSLKNMELKTLERIIDVIEVSPSRQKIRLDLSKNRLENLHELMTVLNRNSLLENLKSLNLNGNNFTSIDIGHILSHFKDGLEQIDLTENPIAHFTYPPLSSFDFYNTSMGKALRFRVGNRSFAVVLASDSYDCCLDRSSNSSGAKICFSRSLAQRNFCFEGLSEKGFAKDTKEVAGRPSVVLTTCMIAAALLVGVGVTALALFLRQRSFKKTSLQRRCDPAEFYSTFFRSSHDALSADLEDRDASTEPILTHHERTELC